MGYDMSVDGMEEISRLLTQLDDAAQGIAARGLYEGAKVMAESMRREMAGIRTAPFRFAKDGETRLPSPEEKAVLEQAGVGVAKFSKNGTEIDTSVGFNSSGYADVEFSHMRSGARTNYKAVSVKGHESNSSGLLRAIGNTEKGSNQKPIGVIANAINSGTSFMQKQPFVRRAEKAGTGKSLQAIRSSIERDFDAIIK